jgi:hypothetical protein
MSSLVSWTDATCNIVASHGIQAIVDTLAGPLAHERHVRKRLPTWELYGDWEQAFGVARFLHPANPEGILAWAEQLTQVFLDEPGIGSALSPLPMF